MDFEKREMTVEEAGCRYAELRQKREAGAINDEEFDARLKELMVRDDEGRYWSKSRKTGDWYYHDGEKWVRGDPPVGEAKSKVSAVENGRRDPKAKPTETSSGTQTKDAISLQARSGGNERVSGGSIPSLMDFPSRLSFRKFAGLALAYLALLDLIWAWGLINGVGLPFSALQLIMNFFLFFLLFSLALRAERWYWALGYALIGNLFGSLLYSFWASVISTDLDASGAIGYVFSGTFVGDFAKYNLLTSVMIGSIAFALKRKLRVKTNKIVVVAVATTILLVAGIQVFLINALVS